MLDKLDRSEVSAGFARSGPVARSLFADPDMITTIAVNRAINSALASGNLFNFTASDLGADHMFLIQPLDVVDETTGQLSLRRGECSFDFLSSYIANCTAELMEPQAEKVRRQLACAFNSTDTCPAAGKLVESMFHRTLIRQNTALPAAFGGGGSGLKANSSSSAQPKIFPFTPSYLGQASVLCIYGRNRPELFPPSTPCSSRTEFSAW
jgi:hypothetical protein